MIISIKALAIDTIIGVYPHEQDIKQRLYLTLKLHYDFSRAVVSDTLSDTLNYDDLCQKIKMALESRSFQLIESVAGTVEQILIKKYGLEHYSIEISKPSALELAEKVSVIIEK